MFRRILVIVAHPDDEILGSGGTLAKFSKESAIRIVFIAEGSSCRFEKSESARIAAEIQYRSECARSALATINISEVYFHNQPCGCLNSIPRIEINQIIEKHIKEFLPDTVITHSSTDANLDHQVVFESTLIATRPNASNMVPTLLSCEILSSSEWAFAKTFQPNFFMPLGDGELDLKIQALHKYPSEIRDFPFPRSSKGVQALAQYRGLQSGNKLAEAFCLVRHIGVPI